MSVRGAGREKKKGKNADESSVAAVAGEPGGSGGGGKPRKFVSNVERRVATCLITEGFGVVLGRAALPAFSLVPCSGRAGSALNTDAGIVPSVSRRGEAGSFLSSWVHPITESEFWLPGCDSGLGSRLASPTLLESFFL